MHRNKVVLSSVTHTEASLTDPAPAPFDPDAFAERIALPLPPACIPGVAQNVALLADHWAALRHALADGDAA